jgi:hypothetical protein
VLRVSALAMRESAMLETGLSSANNPAPADRVDRRPNDGDAAVPAMSRRVRWRQWSINLRTKSSWTRTQIWCQIQTGSHLGDLLYIDIRIADEQFSSELTRVEPRNIHSTWR